MCYNRYCEKIIGGYVYCVIIDIVTKIIGGYVYCVIIGIVTKIIAQFTNTKVSIDSIST